jgi:muramoyltetrapeptide carboxypeptidase LdcA involved in peptidoglycan recycling
MSENLDVSLVEQYLINARNPILNTSKLVFLGDGKYEGLEYCEDLVRGLNDKRTPKTYCKEKNGYEVLNGSGVISGVLYGGCVDSIYNAYVGSRFEGKFLYEPEMVNKYNIMPSLDEWKEMILFIETSELKPTPEELRTYLLEFKKRGILSNIKGLFMGKPADEVYYEEYKNVIKEVFKDLDTPIVYNVNFGHSLPRCLIPYGANATMDLSNKKITIDEPIFEK